MKVCHRASFKKIFNNLRRKHNGYTIFRDFVMMCGISIQNSFLKSDDLEQEYFLIIKKYSRDELYEFPKMLSHLTLALEECHNDFLGEIFMELEIGNSNLGQYFSPYSISKLISELNCGDLDEQLKNKAFVSLSEPACGSGSMIVAFAEVMRSKGFNPQQQLFVECWDLDVVASMMCYIQLSLLNIPARVVTGNTLTLEVYRTFYTPGYYIGGWLFKLQSNQMKKNIIDNYAEEGILEELDDIVDSEVIVKDKEVDLKGQLSFF